LKNLRKALATFAGRGDSGHGGKEDEKDPTKPNEELLADLAEVTKNYWLIWPKLLP